MKTSRTLTMILFATLALGLPAIAQHRDPLNDVESDQLREVAQEPYKRLKLYIKFATERLDTVEQIQKEPQGKGRGQRIHNALEDFRQIVDELDDNIDDFVQKQSDLRKALTETINAENGFDTKLKAIKERAQDPKNAEEYKLYSFVLQDAIESVNLSLEDSKKTMDEQNMAMGKKK
jgi:Skp family chaperone for outer membrane proteins